MRLRSGSEKLGFDFDYRPAWKGTLHDSGFKRTASVSRLPGSPHPGIGNLKRAQPVPDLRGNGRRVPEQNTNNRSEKNVAAETKT